MIFAAEHKPADDYHDVRHCCCERDGDSHS
jgi:hypothetical protein